MFVEMKKNNDYCVKLLKEKRSVPVEKQPSEAIMIGSSSDGGESDSSFDLIRPAPKNIVNRKIQDNKGKGDHNPKKNVQCWVCGAYLGYGRQRMDLCSTY